MSLDVYLNRKVYLSYNKGETYIEQDETVYSNNITHNLGNMADKVGLYDVLWRPYRLRDEYDKSWDYDKEYSFEDSITILAKELIKPMKEGLEKLKSCPDCCKKLNPKNGWGSYEGLVKFTEDYLEACEENPEAVVVVSR